MGSRRNGCSAPLTHEILVSALLHGCPTCGAAPDWMCSGLLGLHRSRVEMGRALLASVKRKRARAAARRDGTDWRGGGGGVGAPPTDDAADRPLTHARTARTRVRLGQG